MAINLSDFLEKAGDISPSSSSFSLRTARAVSPMFVTGNPTTATIGGAITTILGSIKTTAGDGRLQRSLPAGHPLYPWLYASSISSIRGMGEPIQDTGATMLEAPTFPNLINYSVWEFGVEFTPRPYVLAQDASVPLLKNQTFYDESDTKQTTNIAGEWVRFAYFTQVPQYDTITARIGAQMSFQTQSGNEPGNGVVFASMPKLPLPNQILKIYWEQVPFRYVTSKNSYLTRFAGYINQNDWASWKAGTLLYLGCTPKPYTPPVQQLDQQYTGTTGYIYSAEKWCDLELTFLLTTRKGTDVPNTPLANRNFVPAGHNLQPWLGSATTKGGFFYTSVQSTTASLRKPLWPSIEYGLFFTDPDANGVYQIPN